MIIRWQCGNWGGARKEVPWDCLNLSMELMRRCFPKAKFHVNWQGEFCGELQPDVVYHKQDGSNYHPPSMGKLDPLRYGPDEHELWLDNDHIMWDIPEAMYAWLDDPKGAFIWRLKSGYYGSFTGRCPIRATSGFFGLPPNSPPWPPYEHPVPAGGNCDQEEMGYVASYLGQFKQVYFADEGDEFTLYTPGSEGWPAQLEFGTCGTHLSGVNRGNWDPTEVIAQIRSMIL